MSRAQREKGARGEREWVELLIASGTAPDARRRSSGEESQEDQGRDIKNTPGICYQVHNGNSSSHEKKLIEAASAARDGEMPAAAIKRTTGSMRGQFTVTLRAADFLALLKRAMGGVS